MENLPGGEWLRVHAPNPGGVGSIPGQGTKIPYAVGQPPHKKKSKRKCNGFHRERALELEATEPRVSTIT